MHALRRRRARLFDPRGESGCPHLDLHWDFLLRTEMSWLLDDGGKRVRRPGPAPGLGSSQDPGLSDYPTRLMDLPGGAAPPDLRYKGRVVAGPWENENGSPCRRCADFSRLRNGCITAYAYREGWASSESRREPSDDGSLALDLS